MGLPVGCLLVCFFWRVRARTACNCGVGGSCWGVNNERKMGEDGPVRRGLGCFCSGALACSCLNASFFPSFSLFYVPRRNQGLDCRYVMHSALHCTFARKQEGSFLISQELCRHRHQPTQSNHTFLPSGGKSTIHAPAPHSPYPLLKNGRAHASIVTQSAEEVVRWACLLQAKTREQLIITMATWLFCPAFASKRKCSGSK